MVELLSRPWPWYVAGPLIGLTVPLLLLLGNKSFGVSSTLRHLCAACVPAGIPFFQYDWRKESWNLFFVAGITAGGFVAAYWLQNNAPVAIDSRLRETLAGYGVTDLRMLVPQDLFNFSSLLTLRGLILMVAGGFLVGFGTRYAGGCTSGHAIMGIAALQLPSLIATLCFMAGGVVMANFLLPFILKLPS